MNETTPSAAFLLEIGARFDAQAAEFLRIVGGE